MQTPRLMAHREGEDGRRQCPHRHDGAFTEQFRAVFQPQLLSGRVASEASLDVGGERGNRACNSQIWPERHRGPP